MTITSPPAAEVDAASGARDLVARMQRRYPDFGNPSTLILSAVTALKRNRPC